MESAVAETKSHSNVVQNQNKIESFFKVNDKSSYVPETCEKIEKDEIEENFEDQIEDFESLASFLWHCPLCENLIEGNKDFVYQHLDSCMR